MPPNPAVQPAGMGDALDELQAAEEAAREEQPAAVIPPPVSRKKLKVRAKHAGFIHNARRSAGDSFEVYLHELGDWMECEDPVERKKHDQAIKARNKKINQRSFIEDEIDRRMALPDAASDE